MAKNNAVHDEYLKGFDENLLLYRACQRSVLRAELKPAALDAFVGLYAAKVVVCDNSVTLNGQGLDEAIAEVVRKAPELWAQPADQVDQVLSAEKAAEALALEGSVTAHGSLLRMWEQRYGKVEAERRYVAWKLAHAAEPGRRSAVNGAVDDAKKKVDPTNLFSRLRTAAGTIDRAVEAQIGEYTRIHGFAATKKLADEAGTNLSGQKLPGR
jgi:hypothetical protein